MEIRASGVAQGGGGAKVGGELAPKLYEENVKKKQMAIP